MSRVLSTEQAKTVGPLVGILGGVAVGQVLEQSDAWNLTWCMGLLAGLVVGSVLLPAVTRRRAVAARR